MRMSPALLTIAILTSALSSQTAGDPLVGDWRGDSICVVRPSACVDEKALYHVKKLDQPNRYSMQADKIVKPDEPIQLKFDGRDF